MWLIVCVGGKQGQGCGACSNSVTSSFFEQLCVSLCVCVCTWPSVQEGSRARGAVPAGTAAAAEPVLSFGHLRVHRVCVHVAHCFFQAFTCLIMCAAHVALCVCRREAEGQGCGTCRCCSNSVTTSFYEQLCVSLCVCVCVHVAFCAGGKQGQGCGACRSSSSNGSCNSSRNSSGWACSRRRSARHSTSRCVCVCFVCVCVCVCVGVWVWVCVCVFVYVSIGGPASERRVGEGTRIS